MAAVADGETSTSQPSFSGGRHLLAFLVLALVGGVCYFPSFLVPFVYDDLWELVGNRALDDLSDLGTVLRYNPARALLMLTFAVDRHLWGENPLPYHVENLLIHIVAAFLFYRVAEKLLSRVGERPERVSPLETPSGFPVALGLGLLFVSHPLFVEAVTYIASRSSSLCALFYFGAFLSYIRYREAEVLEERSPGLWLLLALNLYVLSVLTKEEGVSLPAVLVAYELLLSPRGKGMGARPSIPTMLKAVLPFGLVLVGLVVGRLVLFGTLMPPVVVRSPIESLLTSPEVLWVYLRLLVLPYDLSLYHDYPIVTDFGRWQTWLALLGHGGLVGLAWGFRRRLPMLAFATVWFYATLSPTTSVIPLKEAMAEHRMYLASVGPLLLLGTLWGRLWQRWLHLGSRGGHLSPSGAENSGAQSSGAENSGAENSAVQGRRWWPLWGLVGLSLGLGVLTFQYNRLWQDEVQLWERALYLSPHSGDAAYALGDALRSRGRLEEAQRAYQQAILNYEALNIDLGRYKFSYVDTLHNLGVVYAQRGMLDLATAQFRRALSINPRYVQGWNSLGYTQLVRGLTLEASLAFEESLRLDPNNWLAHFHMGTLYSTKVLDTEKAARHFKRCLELRPNAPQAEAIRKKLLELGF
ncbi:MAG: tetratricopeptide repeat protein [Myxococcota bacterium]